MNAVSRRALSRFCAALGSRKSREQRPRTVPRQRRSAQSLPAIVMRMAQLGELRHQQRQVGCTLSVKPDGNAELSSLSA